MEIQLDQCVALTIGMSLIDFFCSIVERRMIFFSFRFYDELDYERRVRKRRTKLLSSCEDAFTHVRKCLNEKTGSHIPMDAREAAQVKFSFSCSKRFQWIFLMFRLFFLPCHVHFKNIFV